MLDYPYNREMRLFIAIDLPEEIKRELWYLSLDLRRQAEQARVVPPENYHLTLLFIGETKRVNEVRDALHLLSVPGEPVALALEGIGSFRQQGSRTWWVGVRVTEQLAAIHSELSALFRDAGFAIEARSFKPHITLARKVKASQPITLVAPSYEIRAEQLSLMKSTRETGGMVYTEIDSLLFTVNRKPETDILKKRYQGELLRQKRTYAKPNWEKT